MTGGHTFDEPEPTEECPYCRAECHADYMNVGVGMVQAGPFHCEACGASEVGPYDEPRDLTPAERKAGWYAPGAEPGSSANVIHGKIVSHGEMATAYRAEFVGNPKWEDDAYVQQWKKDIRR